LDNPSIIRKTKLSKILSQWDRKGLTEGKGFLENVALASRVAYTRSRMLACGAVRGHYNCCLHVRLLTNFCTCSFEISPTHSLFCITGWRWEDSISEQKKIRIH